MWPGNLSGRCPPTTLPPCRATARLLSPPPWVTSPHPLPTTDAVTWVVLGSDGLWDVMSNEDAAKMARKSTSPEVAARKLATEAYLRGSEDNISVLVCRVGRE